MIDIENQIEDKCSICLSNFTDVTVLDCEQHKFCFECIKEHLRRSRQCPVCRRETTTLKSSNKLFLLDTLQSPDVRDIAEIEREDLFEEAATRIVSSGAWYPGKTEAIVIVMISMMYTTIGIFVFHLIDTYCWSSKAGIMFVVSVSVSSVVLTQIAIRFPKFTLTRMIIRHYRLTLLVTIFQLIDGTFYIHDLITGHKKYENFCLIVRFWWLFVCGLMTTIDSTTFMQNLILRMR